MRESYGFRTFCCLELALYYSLGKLPNQNRPAIFSDSLRADPAGRVLRKITLPPPVLRGASKIPEPGFSRLSHVGYE